MVELKKTTKKKTGKIRMLPILPKYDFIFKKIFGDQRHSNILIRFLNSIVESKSPIKQVKIENIEITPEVLGGKWSRLDVCAITKKKEIINIEVQLVDEGDMIPRSLYYWSKLFSRQLSSGCDYVELKRTITINILDFKLFEDKRYWHKCLLKDNENNQIITNLLEVHFLELNKMKALKKNSTILEMWLEFLKNPYSKEVVECEKIVPEITQAKSILATISNDPEVQKAWWIKEKAILDRNSSLRNAKTRGLAAGLAAGKAEGLAVGKAEGLAVGKAEGLALGKVEGELKAKKELVLKMYSKNADVEYIADFIGLSVAEVKKIINF